jgi:CTP:molybdopterin cytidylyltransferase MocA
LAGFDSYVGEFVGDGIALLFDFGEHSGGYVKEAKKPAYAIAHESVGGFPAKIVSPRTPGHGLTATYFHNVGHSNGLCLWGKDLTSPQQELVLKIFETIRFGGDVPRYVIPPPPPAKNAVKALVPNQSIMEGPGVWCCVRLSFRSLRMRKPEKIIPIILAAGSSPHLPFPKALAPFHHQTALEIAVNNCSFLGTSFVVLGSDAKRILPAVPRGAKVVINRKWRQGQLSSLLAALRKINDAAFLIYPVDHALLTRNTLAQLVRAFRSRSASQDIVMPRFKDTDGHPAVVSAAVRPEFFKAQTAREVIYQVPRRIRVVNVRTTSIFEDFNTLESYQECLRKFTARKS